MSRSAGAGLAVSLVAFAVYVATLCPTIVAGDSGELAAAAATLGIAHPPGFPLWTVLGRVASLAAPAEPAVALNVLSAACAAGAAGLLVVLLGALTGRVLIPAGLALAFAFARAVWGTAVVTEVYALNLLMTVAALAAAAHGRARPHLLVAAAFLTGLGAANHPFALLAAPAVAWAAFGPGAPAGGARRARPMLGAFALGLSAYLVLWVRWSAGPEINWGGIRAASDLLDHVLRTQYGGLGEAGARTSLGLRFRVAGEVIARSAPAPLLLLAAAGLVLALRAGARRPAALLAVFALAAGPATAAAIRFEDAFLDRTVITPFFLPAVLGVFALATLALVAVQDALRRRIPEPRAAMFLAGVLGFAPAALLFDANRASCDRRDATLARDYGTRLLESLPEGARLFLEGDNAMFALLYLQRVQGVRPDVQLADRTLNLLVHAYGEDFPAMSRVARRQAAVGREVEIAFAETERPVFYGDEIDLTAFGGCRLVPAGYVLQLLRPGEPAAGITLPGSPLPAADPDDFLESHLLGVALYREATWMAWTGRLDEARDRYQQGAEAAWNVPTVVRNCGLGRLELGDFAAAEQLFLRTLELDPDNQDALYDLALLCTYTERDEESLPYFARLDAMNTGFAEVPMNYAVALLRTGRLAEAGAQAGKALALVPDLEPAQRILEAVRKGMEVGGEEGVLEAQRSVGSPTVDGTLQLAQRYLERGDWERATALFREASAQAPDRAAAAYGLGYGLLRVGRTREAAAAFRRVLEIDPDSADGRNALAYVLAETGDSLAVAERLVQEALQLDPALAPYWNDTLGWVRHRAGRHEAALEALRVAEETLPEDDLSMRAENHYHLGRVLLALGRRDEAREHFRESAARATDEPWVRDLEARRRELGEGGAS